MVGKFCITRAFKSDSQRLAFSLRSSIAKRRSHLNAALCAIINFFHFTVFFMKLIPLLKQPRIH
ncbi:hypothetical protein F0249_19510 [Vibrio sp. 03-59-1]|nr:hypothetical protein [Vibrio sp. 03-59-1]